jgi:hypothetical protein
MMYETHPRILQRYEHADHKSACVKGLVTSLWPNHKAVEAEGGGPGWRKLGH